MRTKNKIGSLSASIQEAIRNSNAGLTAEAIAAIVNAGGKATARKVDINYWWNSYKKSLNCPFDFIPGKNGTQGVWVMKGRASAANQHEDNTRSEDRDLLKFLGVRRTRSAWCGEQVEWIATRICQVLRATPAGPAGKGMIQAVEMVLTSPEFKATTIPYKKVGTLEQFRKTGLASAVAAEWEKDMGLLAEAYESKLNPSDDRPRVVIKETLPEEAVDKLERGVKLSLAVKWLGEEIGLIVPLMQKLTALAEQPQHRVVTQVMSGPSSLVGKVDVPQEQTVQPRKARLELFFPFGKHKDCLEEFRRRAGDVFDFHLILEDEEMRIHPKAFAVVASTKEQSLSAFRCSVRDLAKDYRVPYTEFLNWNEFKEKVWDLACARRKEIVAL